MGMDKRVNCDWKDCGSNAANHVRYGFSADPDRAPEVAFHGDYCSRHSDYIEEAFTNTRKFPLGECPDGCDFGGMKVIPRAQQQSFAELVSSRYAPNSDWATVGLSEHFAQFYESDDFISDAVAEYVYQGLRSNETCIVAATSGHIKQIGKILTRFGVDAEDARTNGSYIELDAAKALSRFMVSGMPDPQLFVAVFGELIEAAVQRGRKVRFYGEMVGVLCSNGQFEAALRLEEMANAFRTKHTFSLFCGYPLEALTDNTPPTLFQGSAKNTPGRYRPKAIQILKVPENSTAEDRASPTAKQATRDQACSIRHRAVT